MAFKYSVLMIGLVNRDGSGPHKVVAQDLTFEEAKKAKERARRAARKQPSVEGVGLLEGHPVSFTVACTGKF